MEYFEKRNNENCLCNLFTVTYLNLYRVRWPPKQLCHGQTFQYCGGRDAYVARHTATQQLRYTDPMDVHLHLLPMPVNHLLLDDATVTIAQVIILGSLVGALRSRYGYYCVKEFSF